MDYLYYPSFACNEAPYNGTEACSCTDCQQSCPAPPPVKEPAPQFKIGDVDGVAVIVLIVFLVLVFFFSLYLLYGCMTSKKKPKPELKRGKPSTSSTATMMRYSDDSDSQSGSSCFTDDDEVFVDRSEISKIHHFSKLSQDFFRNVFTKWGTFVARHPLWIIVPTIAIIIGLCIGVKFIELTTDPVELWTAETSRVRQEKTYYDEKFGAFYRTEMVIMKLKPEYEGLGSIYTSYTGKRHNFSEILSKKYLLSLLELQNTIRYMDVEYEWEGTKKTGNLSVRLLLFLLYISFF